MQPTAIEDWDDAYSNHTHVPGADDFPPRWQAAAAAFRAEMEGKGRARLNIAYGRQERQGIDLFLPEGDAKGLAVFVHGGYWRRFHRSDWSHLAAGPLARGWAVAMPSYTLCPQNRVSGVTREVAAAIVRAAEEVEGPLALAGHSAGGHLVTRMAVAGTLDDRVARRVRRIVSISGVHDLRPLLKTSINDDLRLDTGEAASESPALLAPRPGTTLVAWVGAGERPEFVRQSALLANVWQGLGAATASVVEDGRHHFDVIDSLAEADGGLTRTLDDI
jgi:acetyl esterase/lipase